MTDIHEFYILKEEDELSDSRIGGVLNGTAGYSHWKTYLWSAFDIFLSFFLSFFSFFLFSFFLSFFLFFFFLLFKKKKRRRRRRRNSIMIGIFQSKKKRISNILSFLQNRRQTALSRLHIGHSHMTLYFLLKRKDPPVCNPCNVLLSLDHILLHCLNVHLSSFNWLPI